MSRKKSTLKSKPAQKLLLAGVAAGLFAPWIAFAEEVELDTLEVKDRTIDTNPYAEEGAPYKAKISGDKRNVKKIEDTPKTMTVLTQTQIQESGRTDLRQILDAQPGITLGTGENGNAFGDRYIIRGHEARSDVFVDGLRDPGMSIREGFAVEQIEVTKGPSSTFAGQGSTGGTINSITKQASSEYDFIKSQFGVGTDDFYRVTLDANQAFNDNIAARANVLLADQNVPERSPAARERKGLALSSKVTPSDQWDIIADYYLLDSNDMPDIGTYIDTATRKPVKDIPVYAQKEDFLDSKIDTITLRTDFRYSPNVTLSNAIRYGTTENGYVVTGARGATRDATDTWAPGAPTIRLSTHQGWQEVDYLVDQFNAYWNFSTGSVKHNTVWTLEPSNYKVKNGNYTVTNTGATNCILPGNGTNPPSKTHCILDGQGNPVANIDSVYGRQITKGIWDIDYMVETIAYSVMDTLDLTDKWSLFLGVRLDDFRYDNKTQSGNPLRITYYDYEDTLSNGHMGILYKFAEDANVYFTYSTSANINGGESDVGSNCGYGGICVPSGDPAAIAKSKPEAVQNLEIGTKIGFAEDKLLFTAALFQITKDDVMESATGNSYATTGTLNTGKNRVEGIELALVGNVTEYLSLQVGFTHMEAEILESVDTKSIGLTLSNFADDSFFGQVRYQFTEALSLGATATYSSKMYAGQPDTAAGAVFDSANKFLRYSQEVPDYTVFDLFGTYEFSQKLNLRLNLANVTDEDYYLAAYRSGSFTYIGDAFNARATLSLEF
jgi:catecholate siderophore receptor